MNFSDIHVSLLSRKKHEIAVRAPESAFLVDQDLALRTFCLSADGSCIQAEPDIHLLPRACFGRRRRLSLCSLPVPKQLEESLGSNLRRPDGDLRDLAACALHGPDVFPSLARGFTQLPCL